LSLRGVGEIDIVAEVAWERCEAVRWVRRRAVGDSMVFLGGSVAGMGEMFNYRA
jgi:hypothetical protein